MKQNIRRFGALIVTFILSIGMMISAMIPAFAADGGTAEEPAKMAIAKVLTMPEGTITPEMEFIFNIEPLTKDGQPDTEFELPPLSAEPIEFSEDDIGEVENGVKTIRKETGNIFESVQGFSSGGVYEYKVTEELVEDEDESNTQVTYSKAEYILRVYVDNGSIDGGYNPYVKVVYAERILDDAGNMVDGAGSAGGEKVDPAPGESGLVFTNSVIKQGDGTLENAPLSVSKTVEGEYGDFYQKFTFAINVEKPVGAIDGVIYKAYVVSVNDISRNITNIVHSDNPLGDGEHGKCIDFPSGSTVDVYLSHEEMLVFPDMHIGANYSVTEQGAPLYTPSLKINNESIIVPDIGAGDNLPTGIRLVNDEDNAVGYTNTRDAVIPTGAIITNLPYIMVLILAIGAFIGFIAVKARKRS